MPHRWPHRQPPQEGAVRAVRLVRRRTTTSSQSSTSTASCATQFTADRPSAVWFRDISEHPTREGKPYICAVKDVFSNKIVGYSIDSRMKSSLAAAAMRDAIALRSPAGTMRHSDRGRSIQGQEGPATAEEQRPDRVGGPRLRRRRERNASMGSFVSLLQKNVLDNRRLET